MSKKKTKLEKVADQLENKKQTVVRVSTTEYELDNGDIYPISFELDEEISVEEFQKLLDESHKTVVNHLKQIIKDDKENK